MPRWGKVGKQKIEDAGTLYPKRMETVDDEIRDLAFKFIDKAKADGKPFFCLAQPDAHAHRHPSLARSTKRLRNSENGWSKQEAGMAQLDDDVGVVMQKLKDIGVDDNTIVVFTTDNGTETFTWPDGGKTPFAQCKGTVYGRRLPRALHRPLARPHPGGHGAERHLLRPGLVPHLPRRRRQSEHHRGTAEGVRRSATGPTRTISTATTRWTLITGKGPSARHEIFYLGESTVGAVRIDDYKYPLHRPARGWLGEKTHLDVPYITNLRLDPFERMGWPDNGTKDGAQQYFDWFKYEFWRFVFVQQEVAKLAQTAIEYPPMQKGASFNLEAVAAQIRAAIAKRSGQ